jgi:DNA-binding transcriptional regulator YiaG
MKTKEAIEAKKVVQEQIARLLNVFAIETIASRIQVSVRTVERWRDGENKARRKERKQIERMVKRTFPVNTSNV